MREYFGFYAFEIKRFDQNYYYSLYGDKKITSKELFETAQEARFAAIGHINLLEMELEYAE